jgi:cysteine desulfuration protein SufE
METINQAQDNIIEEFSSFDDWFDRYNLIIEYGNSLSGLPESEHTKQNLIEGCQSNVWITAAYNDGVVHFEADSDAILVKGIVAMLLNVLNNHTPREILDADLYFIDRINLREHLSPTRSNGLVAMLKQMKDYAMVFDAKYQ